MNITFEKPKTQPLFEAVIYTTQQHPDVYRIMVGQEGTEANYQESLLEIIGSSGLIEREGIARWVKERLGKIPTGKKVEIDENFRYNMSYALEELADESPITIE